MADVKPDIKPDIKNEPITLTLKDALGEVLTFKVKPTTKFEKIVSAYATKKSIASVDSIRVLLDGKRVKLDETPEELGLTNGDQLDVMLEQTGGCSC